MQSAFFKPTDLAAPGAIENLLAFHKARFGDARMEGEGGGDGGGDGGDGGGDKGTKAGGTSTSTDKGFPENTPLSEMTVDQREAYWKDKAQKHEARSKKFDGLSDEEFAALKDKASKHDALERELMSDKDKATAEAREKALAEAAPRVVRAEFKAAAKGVLTQDQLNALLEDLDLSKYANAKGEPDEDKIAKKIAAFAPAKPTRTGPTATGLGHRTGGTGAPGDQGRAMAERRFGKKS